MADIAALKQVLTAVQEADALEKAGTPIQVHWRQGVWAAVLDEMSPSCGTAMCFAGWKAYLDGYTENVWDTNDYDEPYLLALRNPKTDEDIPSDGVGFYAAEVLELDSYEADTLFEGSNTLEDLESIVADIEAGTLTRDEEDDY